MPGQFVTRALHRNSEQLRVLPPSKPTSTFVSQSLLPMEQPMLVSGGRQSDLAHVPLICFLDIKCNSEQHPPNAARENQACLPQIGRVTGRSANNARQ